MPHSLTELNAMSEDQLKSIAESLNIRMVRFDRDIFCLKSFVLRYIVCKLSLREADHRSACFSGLFNELK